MQKGTQERTRTPRVPNRTHDLACNKPRHAQVEGGGGGEGERIETDQLRHGLKNERPSRHGLAFRCLLSLSTYGLSTRIICYTYGTTEY